MGVRSESLSPSPGIHNLDPSDPRVASGIRTLANIYSAQGRYGEAEALYRESLSLVEKEQGSEQSMHVANTVNDLGEMYLAQSRFSEFEQLREGALPVSSQFLDPGIRLSEQPCTSWDHSDTSKAVTSKPRPSYVGRWPYEKGPWEAKAPTSLEPSTIWRRFAAPRVAMRRPRFSTAARWTSDRKTLGPQHPNIAILLNNLGDLYYTRRQYAEAESAYTRALTAQEKALGPSHPQVANRLDKLARSRHSAGRVR